MRVIIQLSFIAVLSIALGAGISRFKRLDNAMRVVVAYIAAQLVSEFYLYIEIAPRDWDTRGVVINTYNLCEIYFITIFFIYALKPYYYRKLMLANAVVWPVIWILNIILFQPIVDVDTNFLLLESFCTITLSLYYIYWLLRNSVVKNIFRHPHFWVAALWLLLWSVTFFFWMFVKILYSERWPYINFAMYFHMIVNIIVYACIGLALWFYPKKVGTNETI